MVAEWFGGDMGPRSGIAESDTQAAPQREWSDWEKEFAVIPRKINGEWHWMRSVYKRHKWVWGSSSREKSVKRYEYGTLVDVMTKPNGIAFSVEYARRHQGWGGGGIKA